MDIGQINHAAKGVQAQSSPALATGNQSAKAAQSPSPIQTATAVQQAGSAAATGQAEQAVDEINKALQARSAGIEFSIDPDTDRTIVKVVNQQTREVIRQIPTEEALTISKSLDQIEGLLIHQKA